MRFLARSLTGLALACLTLALVGWGALGLWRTIEAERAAEAPRPPRAERAIPVQVANLRPETVRPTFAAYGRIEAARRLELRAAQGGALVELSAQFRDGGEVAEGELLFRIDPAEATSARERARIARDEAEAEARIAAAALELARKDFEGAGVQRDLRARALARQEGLRDRGIGTETATETAALALAAAEQALVAREQALLAAENRAAVAEIALRRAALALADAERALAETEMRAPFAGLLTATTATLGRRVAPGETLGELLDPTAWEAVVEAPSAEVARVLGPEGRLPALAAEVRLALGEESRAFPARLARVGATSDAAGAGRTLYLALAPAAARVLRPGDFVGARIEGRALEGVARAPAAALDAFDALLVVGEDDRLREVRLVVTQRLGNDVIAAEAPFGARYVLRRRPNLGPGVLVKPIEPEVDAGPEARIALTPGLRAELAARVEAETSLSPEGRARLLADLQRDAIDRETLQRIEGLAPQRAATAASDG